MVNHPIATPKSVLNHHHRPLPIKEPPPLRLINRQLAQLTRLGQQKRRLVHMFVIVDFVHHPPLELVAHGPGYDHDGDRGQADEHGPHAAAVDMANDALGPVS